MIYWSCGELTSEIEAVQSSSIEELLGGKELAEYTRFRIDKRKREYLGSRLAVKQLIAGCCPVDQNSRFFQVEVVKEESGVPHIEVKGERLAGLLSLSHSQGWFFCAYSPRGVPFGVDIESIENRPADFISDYFTDEEIQRINAEPPETQAMIATLNWSAKEAVLKALSKGLSLDTRKVEVGIPRNLEPGLENWQVLGLRANISEIPFRQLFWRREGNFVLTICMAANHTQELIRIDTQSGS